MANSNNLRVVTRSRNVQFLFGLYQHDYTAVVQDGPNGEDIVLMEIEGQRSNFDSLDANLKTEIRIMPNSGIRVITENGQRKIVFPGDIPPLNVDIGKPAGVDNEVAIHTNVTPYDPVENGEGEAFTSNNVQDVYRKARSLTFYATEIHNLSLDYDETTLNSNSLNWTISRYAELNVVNYPRGSHIDAPGRNNFIEIPNIEIPFLGEGFVSHFHLRDMLNVPDNRTLEEHFKNLEGYDGVSSREISPTEKATLVLGHAQTIITEESNKMATEIRRRVSSIADLRQKAREKQQLYIDDYNEIFVILRNGRLSNSQKRTRVYDKIDDINVHIRGLNLDINQMKAEIVLVREDISETKNMFDDISDIAGSSFFKDLLGFDIGSPFDTTLNSQRDILNEELSLSNDFLRTISNGVNILEQNLITDNNTLGGFSIGGVNIGRSQDGFIEIDVSSGSLSIPSSVSGITIPPSLGITTGNTGLDRTIRDLINNEQDGSGVPLNGRFRPYDWRHGPIDIGTNFNGQSGNREIKTEEEEREGISFGYIYNSGAAFVRSVVANVSGFWAPIAGAVSDFFQPGRGNLGTDGSEDVSGLTDPLAIAGHIGWSGRQKEIDPLVLDLDGDGIELKPFAGNQIFFDVDNDGNMERTGWVGEDDGILVHDRNGNGRIDDITETISEYYGAAKGTGAIYTDGFDALRTLDSNADGVINNEDSAFANLRVWQDANGNAETDTGELKTLSSLGITEFSTADTKKWQKAAVVGGFNV